MNVPEVAQSILVHYAPSDKARAYVTAVYNCMMADPRMPEEEVTKQVMGAISDGLKYGNWPWTGHDDSLLDEFVAEYKTRINLFKAEEHVEMFDERALAIDSDEMPIYSGPANQAHTKLTPGIYRAQLGVDDECFVHVTETAATIIDTEQTPVELTDCVNTEIN